MSKKKKIRNGQPSLSQNEISSNPKILYQAVVVVWIVYVFFQIQSPTRSADIFNISTFTLRLLQLSISVPYLFIWLSAVYSYSKIKKYVHKLGAGKEARAFDMIAAGILTILLGLIFSSVLGSLRNYFGQVAVLRQVLTVISNYMYVYPYFIAYIFILNGSVRLSKLLENGNIPINRYFYYGIPLIFFVWVWLELIFTNQYRLLEPGRGIGATYYLTDSILILTLVIPSLVSWSIGVLAFLKLGVYLKHVNGFIYKRLLSQLVIGLSIIIFASMFLQALLSLGPQRLLDLGLSQLLGVIYVLIFLQLSGFLFIARGSGKLMKIETV